MLHHIFDPSQGTAPICRRHFFFSISSNAPIKTGRVLFHAEALPLEALITDRADADHLDRAAEQLLHAGDVVLGRGRQLVKAAADRKILRKAGQLLVNGSTLLQQLQRGGEIGGHAAVGQTVAYNGNAENEGRVR